ncbi:molybdopterin molybdotransferase MoeA [Campylobacter volucris]|uniref:Molybdopterin molybdenumtransferase n=1 Tax=Campylobacter volucris TaxID=1031542 RepID=A0AAE5YHA7_9BACT|nr:molybdopterin molybdotransferase MoeA [Campylobacter volucris]AJC93683.1 molybdopterin molybdenumtransferase [Campylobacter volucris LMG 24379]KAB0579838.1 molybdopterin molybdotransferase MoeA [Campylobacter volucris]QBL13935.1 molybdopterin molybdenumtransferase MoeA [Campylobacter volucris]QEL07896.1 molybdopterin molybdenumtransferase [Campylobacter volucris]TXK70762.1 molybdopterin molybdotransferase MoeA [Campylobacter volucris]
MQSYEDSLKSLKQAINSYEKIEKIALTECLDRILATDIIALKDYPEIPTSAMDGYAIKFKDQDENLKIIGEVPAGIFPSFNLKDKECVKTFTGSLMSEGSDTLIPIEKIEVKENTLIIKEKVNKGFAVRKIGESYKKGEILLKKGTKINYSEIALLAELGYFHISVFIKPIIGVLSSGSEIKDLGESLDNLAQIRSSNHVAIANMAKKLNCDVRIFPLLKDDKEKTNSTLKQALNSCDILITTGGVSMGDFDFLKQAIKDYQIIIDKVNIKPGKHIKIAKCEEKFIFALPGFPYSAMVMFNLYVRELLNAWLLQEKDYVFKAFLNTDYKKKSQHLEFVACNIEFKDGKIYANLKGKKEGSSAIINNLNNKAALMIVNDDIKENDLVDILLMP